MAKTTGDRSKEEANAFKARAWFRDAVSDMFGVGEYREANGKPLKMRHELREMRIEVSQEKRTAQKIRRCGTAWSDVHSVEFIGVCQREERQKQELSDILDVLLKQTPDLFNRFDEPKQLMSEDVPLHKLGSFKTGAGWEEILKQQEEKHASIDAFSLDMPTC
jgi:hypothetical protein